jgi:hypothetical protein
MGLVRSLEEALSFFRYFCISSIIEEPMFGGMMVYVRVILSPSGIHRAEVETPFDEEEEARRFYAKLEPHLKELDRRINQWRRSKGAGSAEEQSRMN